MEKSEDAVKYFIQLSTDVSFTTAAIVDSTTDTSKTITNLLDGKKYFWRVRVKNVAGYSGPWSEAWNFTTYISLPGAPQLVSATPYPSRQGWITFKWRKVKEAELYYFQSSYVQNFSTIFQAATTTDTVTTIISFDEGQNYYWRVQSKNIAGYGPWSETSSILVDVKKDELPTEYSLSQNYPNPFNPATTINFSIADKSHVQLSVFNLLGEVVKTLVDQNEETGVHSMTWNGLNESGIPVNSGVYLLRLEAGSQIQMRKMILLK
ncbi:MAG: T9SS type A sorting domain-containing protein [Ignavibacteria bacterium]|nr:T9SS type A sorting domain-containing protein [Ignavibacteria bacterium]